MEKYSALAAANSDLQKKVGELKTVSAECENLKSTLSAVSTEYEGARTEVQSLSGKVRNLEQVLDEMRRAAESRQEIERQHKEALECLRRRQADQEEAQANSTKELIETLKVKLTGLEEERRMQNDRHQELILEMAELKKYGKAESVIGSDIEQPSDNLEIDQIMAKLEQDNKFLEDLEKQRAEQHHHGGKSKKGSGTMGAASSSNTTGESPSPPAATTGLHRTNSAITDSGFLSQSSLNGSSTSPTSKINGANNNGGSSGSLHKLPGLTGAEKVNLLNRHVIHHFLED